MPSTDYGIWCTPHLTGMYGTRPFFGWDRARGGLRPCARSLPKIPSAPSAFPLLGAPQAPGNEPNPPRKGVKAWGEGPLRPKEISRYRDTLGQIRAADNTAGRSATRHPSTDYNTMIHPDFYLNDLDIYYSYSRDPQEHNPFQRLCLLTGDPCSTTRVGIATFLFYITQTNNKAIYSYGMRPNNDYYFFLKEISTFVGYLMPKTSFQKNSCGFI